MYVLFLNKFYFDALYDTLAVGALMEGSGAAGIEPTAVRSGRAKGASTHRTSSERMVGKDLDIAVSQELRS